MRVLVAMTLIVAAYAGAAFQSATTQSTKPRPEITVESKLSYNETIEAVKAAAVELKFSVVFEVDVTKRLKDKGFEQPPTMILGVCSAKYAYEALQQDSRVVVMLPCRIAVFEKGGKVFASTADVRQVAKDYNGLEKLSNEVHAVLMKVLDTVRK